MSTIESKRKYIKTTNRAIAYWLLAIASHAQRLSLRLINCGTCYIAEKIKLMTTAAAAAAIETVVTTKKKQKKMAHELYRGK